MLKRENEIRLSNNTNELIKKLGSDMYGDIMNNIQINVGLEFGFNKNNVNLAVELIRSAENIFEHDSIKLNNIREISYYRKFNRCHDGNIKIGTIPPKLPLLYDYSNNLIPIDILDEYYYKLNKPLVLLSGSYS